MLQVTECVEVTPTMTKAELLAAAKKLLQSNATLRKEIDTLHDENVKLREQNEILQGQIGNMWFVIHKAVDLKEILDDAEDIAEELKDACRSISRSGKDTDEDD